MEELNECIHRPVPLLLRVALLLGAVKVRLQRGKADWLGGDCRKAVGVVDAGLQEPSCQAGDVGFRDKGQHLSRTVRRQTGPGGTCPRCILPMHYSCNFQGESHDIPRSSTLCASLMGAHSRLWTR